MGAESWKDADNDGLDDWRPKEEDGPPGYMLPPANGQFPKYLRPFLNEPTTLIMNGCPRCAGVVSYRRRDGARHCKVCDRTFYPCSDDTITRYVPPPDTEG